MVDYRCESRKGSDYESSFAITWGGMFLKNN